MYDKGSGVITEDIKAIYNELKIHLDKAERSTWLVSGGAGFIGSYFLDLLDYCNNNIFSSPCKVICIDNFITGIPERIKHLTDNKYIKIINSDIVKPIKLEEDIDYIIHAASIASPTFYRKHPIETIEVNVLGLKNLLDFALSKEIKSFLFFSTSEIYGDPSSDNIPTPESYNGNVSCTGPRACYDESKRLGETLAVNYYRQYDLPVKIVRPFNVFGPGLKLEDKRVIPDFCSDALYGRKISILSDGTPTRIYCYIKDAMCGFLAVLFSDYNGEAFNIGNDEREISVSGLAELISGITGAEVEYGVSADRDYLTDNPQRRCPDLSKAKKLLGYSPGTGLEDGLKRILRWYKETYFNI